MEILALIEENAMQIICSVAVIISIVTGRTKTAEQAKKKKEKILAKLKKKETKQRRKIKKILAKLKEKETKQVASLQKTLKKQSEYEKKGDQ